MKVVGLLLTLLASTYATSTIESREPSSQEDPWGEEPSTGITNAPTSGNVGSVGPTQADMADMTAMPPMGAGSNPSAGPDMANMGNMSPPPPDSGGSGNRNAGTPPPFADSLADLYGFLPVMRVAKTVSLDPVLSPTNKRAKFRFGPFTIPERGGQRSENTILPSMDDDGVAFLSILRGGICSNCTVLSGKTALELTNGTSADYNTGLYIHHLLMSDISKPMALPVSVCDSAARPGAAVNHRNPFSRLDGILGSGFLGTGDNVGSSSTMFTTLDGNYKSGYFIGKKDNFAVTFDLVNENPTKQDVYVALDLEWVDGHVGSDAAKMTLSVAGCKLDPIKLNATGVATTRSRGYDVMADGDLVYAQGQMHEGGDHMRLYLNNEKVCDSVAKYGSDGMGQIITEMSVCDKAIPVKQGDRISLESVYDLGKHKLRFADRGLLKAQKGGFPTMALWELTFAMKDANKTPW